MTKNKENTESNPSPKQEAAPVTSNTSTATDSKKTKAPTKKTAGGAVVGNYGIHKMHGYKK